HVQLDHRLVQRVPVLAAHVGHFSTALARVGVDFDADEAELVDAALEPGDCGSAPMPAKRSGCSFTHCAIMSLTDCVIVITKPTRRSAVGTAQGRGAISCTSVPTPVTSSRCGAIEASSWSSERT